MKFCSNCGAELTNGTKFCAKCGKPINQGDNEKTQVKRESKINKKVVYAFLAVIGIILLIAFGTIFYSDYSERRAIKLAHEQLVADSLEAERQDSIEKVKLEKLEEEKKVKMEACLSYIKKFYQDYEKTGQDGGFLRKHCTPNAIRILEEKYDYDCDEGGCLATWIFFYEAGSDSELVKREFVAIDENTCEVNNFWGQNGVCNEGIYRVTIDVVEKDGQYKIDNITTSYAN